MKLSPQVVVSYGFITYRYKIKLLASIIHSYGTSGKLCYRKQDHQLIEVALAFSNDQRAK